MEVDDIETIVLTRPAVQIHDRWINVRVEGTDANKTTGNVSPYASPLSLAAFHLLALWVTKRQTPSPSLPLISYYSHQLCDWLCNATNGCGNPK